MTGRYAAFGATWASPVALPDFDPADGSPAADDIAVRLVDALAPRDGGRAINGGFAFADGFRCAWRDEAVFDGHGGNRIDCLPGPGWRGAMPPAFYGTVAALTLAGRGALPCHASAVEVDGRAILIAGQAGAGKSTLTAALLADGARLIGDDLTMIHRAPDGGFVAARGRPGIRLHADTAARVPAHARWPMPDDDRGKWLVRPLARSTAACRPLGGVLLLGDPAGRLAPHHAAMRLAGHLFRPRWLAALAGHDARLRMMLAIAGDVPCAGVDPGAGFHRDSGTIARAQGTIADLLRR